MLIVGGMGHIMTTLAGMQQFLTQDLWRIDASALSLVRRIGMHALRLTIAVVMEFRHRLLDARAAGLVYTTLLSLVPFLAVMVSVLKAFGVHQQIEPVLAQALEPLGSKGQEITATIIGFVDNLKIGVLGVVGVAGLFYTTYSLIDKIEQALNAIWLVGEGRPWSRKFRRLPERRLGRSMQEVVGQSIACRVPPPPRLQTMTVRNDVEAMDQRCGSHARSFSGWMNAHPHGYQFGFMGKGHVPRR